VPQKELDLLTGGAFEPAWEHKPLRSSTGLLLDFGDLPLRICAKDFSGITRPSIQGGSAKVSPGVHSCSRRPKVGRLIKVAIAVGIVVLTTAVARAENSECFGTEKLEFEAEQKIYC